MTVNFDGGMVEFLCTQAWRDPLVYALSNGHLMGDLRYRPALTDRRWAWIGLGDRPGEAWALPSSCEAARSADQAKAHPKCQAVKPGRAIRAILTEEAQCAIDDAEIEALVNALKAHQERLSGVTVDLLRGDDVASAYAGNSTGIDSCMQGCSPNRFALYARNPEKVGLLAMMDGDMLLARALVWFADDGCAYVDRAYGTDARIRALHDEARARGWYKKSRDTIDHGARFDWIDPATGEYAHRAVTVTLSVVWHDEYPYLDTLMYLDTGRGALSNAWTSGCHALRSTDGEGPDDSLVECADCGAEIDTDDDGTCTWGGDYYCSDCYHGHLCEGCDEFSPALDEGYCPSCIDDHRCRDCRAVVESLDEGYCRWCIGSHRCVSCQVVAESLAEINFTGDGTCEECAVPRCADCRTVIPIEDDPDVYSDRRYLYCDGCRPAHTCAECQGIEPTSDPMRGGYCNGCRSAHTCRTCFDVATFDRILTVKEITRFSSGIMPSTHTRIVGVRCLACERVRVRDMLHRLRLRHLEAQERAGQIALPLAAD